MAESRAYCMDCMEAMKQMPDKCFDLAIVDPPYGIGVTGTPGGGNKQYIPFGGQLKLEEQIPLVEEKRIRIGGG